MKKLLLFCLLPMISRSQENNTKPNITGSIEQRFSHQDTYTLVYGEYEKKNITLDAAYNADARGMVHAECMYTILPQIKVGCGVGFHPYQDGFHPLLVLFFKNKKDTVGYSYRGYVRMYFDHMQFIASEAELVRNMNRLHIGLVEEIGIGKKFARWKESKETYTEPEFEQVYLGGLVTSYDITERFTAKVFGMYGKDNQYKISIGLECEF